MHPPHKENATQKQNYNSEFEGGNTYLLPVVSLVRSVGLISSIVAPPLCVISKGDYEGTGGNAAGVGEMRKAATVPIETL
jgi:hypothetical protein